MVNKQFKLFYLSVSFLFLTNLFSAFAISIPDDFQWQNYFVELDEANFYAIASDSNGNVYATGTAKNGSTIARILQKYTANGIQVSGVSGPNAPWFVGYLSTSGYLDYPWHRIVVDETHSRLYIFFAAMDPTASGTYSFWLASHEMNDGQKSPSWGSVTKYVGSSKALRGGIDIDSNGDIWTVIEGEKNFAGSGIAEGLDIKKWSASDGSEITSSRIENYSPNKNKNFIAIGIRKIDNNIYIAYREEGYDGGLTIYDLVVTFWDSNSQFIRRTELALEIPAPDAPTEIHHPSFHEGFVDSNGNFVVGGFYFYTREIEGYESYGSERYFHPVVSKFDTNLNEIFRLIHVGNYQVHEMADGIDEIRAVLDPWPNDLTLYSIGPHWNPTKILIDNSGQVVDTKTLWAPIKLLERVEYPPESDNFYVGWTNLYDFTYIPSSQRLVETGPTALRPIQGDWPDWPEILQYDGSVVLSFSHKVFRVAPGLVKFEWGQIYAMAEWAKKYILPDLGFDPTKPKAPGIGPIPDPEPCPKCKFSFSADWQPAHVPHYLTDIYRSGFGYLTNYDKYSQKELVTKHLTKLIETAPTGRHFTDALKKNVQEELKKLQTARSKSEASFDNLVQAVNAIDLDWRVPAIPLKKIEAGKNKLVDFRGVAWIQLKNNKSPGNCTLSVKGNMPSLAEGFEPGWPIASYQFDFKGIKPDDIIISIYIGGMSFQGNHRLPRLLEWDGKKYKDITTQVDMKRKVITGKTKQLSTYVIMNALPEKNPMKK